MSEARPSRLFPRLVRIVVAVVICAIAAWALRSGGVVHSGAPVARLDTVFVVPGSHLDIGFTGPISQVLARRVQFIDQAIAMAEADPAFVWFEEGGWSVEAWLDHYHADTARIARLRVLVTSGRIGVGATLLSAHAAAFPHALSLLTTHLDRIERELGRRPTVAVLNDVPAAPEALVDALATAGIKFLLGAPNLTFSPALPAAISLQPFYWESSRGNRVLTYLDPEGYGIGLAWGLPPECARFFSPRRFPKDVSDDSVLSLGAAVELAHRSTVFPITVIQHAYDNWEPGCASRLPAAVALWNARPGVTKIVLATPDVYFTHLLARPDLQIPVRKGEWGGDWDLLRASEPVWSWRLRQAMAAVTPATPHAEQLLLATAMDHNVGLGPRWQDNLGEALAMQHVNQVAELYRQAVQGTLGARGLTMVPQPLAKPAAGAFPEPWHALVGDPATAVRVRAGPGFLHPIVSATAPVIPGASSVTADEHRMLVHLQLDRARFEALVGQQRFNAVIEIRLQVSGDSLRLASEDSPNAQAGRWLLGSPPGTVIAPEDVRVIGPRVQIKVHAPLCLAWSLFPDSKDPNVTWLQALAFVDVNAGPIAGGAVLQRPFAVMYPGEPSVVDFDIEIERVPR